MFETISIKNALKQAHEGKAVFFDVRNKSAYEKGCLPGAKWLADEDVEDACGKYGSNKMIFYCEYGNYSLRLVRDLAVEGYENLASLIGGYQAYLNFLELEQNRMSITEIQADEM